MNGKLSENFLDKDFLHCIELHVYHLKIGNFLLKNIVRLIISLNLYKQIGESSVCKSWHYFLSTFRYECNYFWCLYCNIDAERKTQNDLVSTQWIEDMFPNLSNSEKWNVLVLVFLTL